MPGWLVGLPLRLVLLVTVWVCRTPRRLLFTTAVVLAAVYLLPLRSDLS
jgi:hypothetical protein